MQANALVSRTRTRRGSQVSTVVIVRVCQSEPMTEAPISQATTTRGAVVPCRMPLRLRSLKRGSSTPPTANRQKFSVRGVPGGGPSRPSTCGIGAAGQARRHPGVRRLPAGRQFGRADVLGVEERQDARHGDAEDGEQRQDPDHPPGQHPAQLAGGQRPHHSTPGCSPVSSRKTASRLTSCGRSSVR